MTCDSVIDTKDDLDNFSLARDCQLVDPRGDVDEDGDMDGDDLVLPSQRP